MLVKVKTFVKSMLPKINGGNYLIISKLHGIFA